MDLDPSCILRADVPVNYTAIARRPADVARQGQQLLRVDFDTSAGDETYTKLKASLEMAKQLTKLLAEALIGPAAEEGAEPAGETFRV